MSIGDQSDMFSRLKATLPRWFSDTTPILDAVLYGWATTWAFVYSLYAYAKLQTRISTATDGWLDMIAGDWFGAFLQRRSGQTDASYRALILAWILRERATRYGMAKVLLDVTGRAALVFEPNRPLDTGAYNIAWGYNSVGGYSSINLPRNTVLVIAYRPLIGSAQFGVQDADIYSAVEAVRPVGVTVWVQIQN